MLKEEVIDKFGGEDSLKSFLKYMAKEAAELRSGVSLKNIFLVKYEIDKRYGSGADYIRIYWSGDNYPECQKIYWDNFSRNVDDLLLSEYRDYKLECILA